MQNKLNGGQKTKTSKIEQAVKERRKEEHVDWHNGLLTIGTFGNKDVNDPPKSPNKNHFYDIPIDDQITEFLSLQKGSSLPTESILEIIRALGDWKESCNVNLSSKDLSGFTDDNHLGTKKSIKKRAMQFLHIKTFLGGVKPIFTPRLKDPLEIRFEKSRMEKILRAILHKKVHPQSSGSKAPARKCLDTKRVTYDEWEEEAAGETGEGCKWVKTDSDYIVLEI